MPARTPTTGRWLAHARDLGPAGSVLPGPARQLVSRMRCQRAHRRGQPDLVVRAAPRRSRSRGRRGPQGRAVL